MAQVNKREVIQQLVDGLRLEAGVDRIPVSISEVIQPVYVSNPDMVCDSFGQGTTTTTGTSYTLFTPPTDKDFFVTGCFLQLQADAASDLLEAAITARIGGVNRKIAVIRKLTTTASTITLPLVFHAPIKIDRGISVVYGGAWTAGNAVITAQLTGFTK